MIQITPIYQLTLEDLEQIMPQDCTEVLSLKQRQPEESLAINCLLVHKEGQVIGYGSITPATNVPLTAGIGKLIHYYITPHERHQGYGQQLLRHLLQSAKRQFDLLEVPLACPWRATRGAIIDLTTINI